MTGSLRPAAHRPPTPATDRGWRGRLEVIWAEVETIGLDDISRADLERWRTQLLPAQFKRLCHRLDRALTKLAADRSRPTYRTIPLPFAEPEWSRS